jgi:hypothetical protein
MIQVTGTIEQPKGSGVIIFTNPIINVKFYSLSKFSGTQVVCEIGDIITENGVEVFNVDAEILHFIFPTNNPNFKEVQDESIIKLGKEFPLIELIIK